MWRANSSSNGVIQRLMCLDLENPTLRRPRPEWGFWSTEKNYTRNHTFLLKPLRVATWSQWHLYSHERGPCNYCSPRCDTEDQNSCGRVAQISTCYVSSLIQPLCVLINLNYKFLFFVPFVPCCSWRPLFSFFALFYFVRELEEVKLVSENKMFPTPNPILWFFWLGNNGYEK